MWWQLCILKPRCQMVEVLSGFCGHHLHVQGQPIVILGFCLDLMDLMVFRGGEEIGYNLQQHFFILSTTLQSE